MLPPPCQCFALIVISFPFTSTLIFGPDLQIFGQLVLRGVFQPPRYLASSNPPPPSCQWSPVTYLQVHAIPCLPPPTLIQSWSGFWWWWRHNKLYLTYKSCFTNIQKVYPSNLINPSPSQQLPSPLTPPLSSPSGAATPAFLVQQINFSNFQAE